jgi:hypothetical protein
MSAVAAMTAGIWLALSAAPAAAYVRAVADSGAPLAWKSPSIEMDFFVGNAPATMSADEYVAAAGIGARAWSHTALACTALSITVHAQSASTAETGRDGKNVIIFRQDNWCDQATPEVCYSPNALAVTSVFKNKVTGEIVDADMELNAVRFTWADLVAHPELAAGSTVDFQNTVTHELGHVIGLAHPCYSASDGGGRLNDNNGIPELDCSDPNLPPSVRETTMFPSVSFGDTQRRTLSPDDAQAACDTYPAPPPNSGCSFVAAPGEHSVTAFCATVVLLALAFLAVHRAHRRKRVSARIYPARRVYRRRVRRLPTCLSSAGAHSATVRDPCRSGGRSSRCGL